MTTNKNRRKAWKGACGSINATAETWKLAKLTFQWSSIGTLQFGDHPAIPLTDLDAQDGELKFAVLYSREVQSQLAQLFKRLTFDSKLIKISLSLNDLEIQFDRGVIRIWVTCPEDLVGADELPLAFSPVARVTKRGREVVLK